MDSEKESVLNAEKFIDIDKLNVTLTQTIKMKNDKQISISDEEGESDYLNPSTSITVYGNPIKT